MNRDQTYTGVVMEKRLPRCPWCGALMQPCENNTVYWYSCRNQACGAGSPARKTAEEAYTVAVKLTGNWVSVADELPESEMYVLGFDEKKQCDYPYLRFCPDTQEFCDDMYPGKPVKITHWMPYPDEPKEDEEDE